MAITVGNQLMHSVCLCGNQNSKCQWKCTAVPLSVAKELLRTHMKKNKQTKKCLGHWGAWRFFTLLTQLNYLMIMRTRSLGLSCCKSWKAERKVCVQWFAFPSL